MRKREWHTFWFLGSSYHFYFSLALGDTLGVLENAIQ